MNNIENNDFKVKSLAKAMKILECFTAERPELGVTEIAKMTGLHKSSVHNMISTFCDMGYVSFNQDNSRYYLGLRLLHFGYIINTHLGIRNIFLPYMQKIANAVLENAYLGIPDSSNVLYIEAMAPHGNPARNILGERAPLYCTGLGKAMLAYLPDFDNRIPQMKAFTDNTITDKETLLADLEQTRFRGYAIDNMEHEYGVKCVALPIFGHNGEVIAAISVSAPSLRMGADTMEKVAGSMAELLTPIQRVL